MEQNQILLSLLFPGAQGYTKYHQVLVYRNNVPGGVPSEWVSIGPDWEVDTVNLAGRVFENLDRAGPFPALDVAAGNFCCIDSDEREQQLIPALQRAFQRATMLGYQNLGPILQPDPSVWIIVDVRSASFGQQLTVAEIGMVVGQNGVGTLVRGPETLFVKRIIRANLMTELAAFRPNVNAGLRLTDAVNANAPGLPVTFASQFDLAVMPVPTPYPPLHWNLDNATEGPPADGRAPVVFGPERRRPDPLQPGLGS